jgi:hypothetical protein
VHEKHLFEENEQIRIDMIDEKITDERLLDSKYS